MTKYLIHIGICGFGNQLLGFKEACIIAKHTDRVIVEPIFIPHGTIRNECKNYYKFSDIFDSDLFSSTNKYASVEKISNIKVNNVYNMRSHSEKSLTDDYYNRQKDYYNLFNDVKFNSLNKTYITKVEDFNELKNIDDTILVLLGTFNNVILSNCYKNGCLNPKCSLNTIFTDIYTKTTQSIQFNKNIKNIVNETLELTNTNIDSLCVFHMRVLDLCKNKTFEYAYNHDEKSVYKSICNYLDEINESSLKKNIFLIAPPQYKTISNLKIFNTNIVKSIDYDKFSYDKFILSLTELYICEKCKILIISPTNTPNIVKTHTRSSFTLHTKNIRELKNVSKDDVCISSIYKKI